MNVARFVVLAVTATLAIAGTWVPPYVSGGAVVSESDLARAIAFRQGFHLPADASYVRSTFADPEATANSDLTPWPGRTA